MKKNDGSIIVQKAILSKKESCRWQVGFVDKKMIEIVVYCIIHENIRLMIDKCRNIIEISKSECYNYKDSQTCYMRCIYNINST